MVMKADPQAEIELQERLTDWRPNVVGTLMFLIDGNRVLLIRKKRGHGAGKINAPGGKLHVGESPLDCAVRETREEVGITASNPVQVAKLKFVERVDEQWLGYVYVATEFEGKPVETDEANPSWYTLDAIPYDEMWLAFALHDALRFCGQEPITVQERVDVRAQRADLVLELIRFGRDRRR